jgi:phosphosulfolactate phosphohydrolase-like enzyme
VGSYLAHSKKPLRRNNAARRLSLLGYERDIDFCLTEDAVPVVPRLEGDAFVGRQ